VYDYWLCQTVLCKTVVCYWLFFQVGYEPLLPVPSTTLFGSKVLMYPNVLKYRMFSLQFFYLMHFKLCYMLDIFTFCLGYCMVLCILLVWMNHLLYLFLQLWNGWFDLSVITQCIMLNCFISVILATKSVMSTFNAIIWGELKANCVYPRFFFLT